MTDEEELAGFVQIVIDDNATTVDLSPSWIATQVMCDIAFPRALHRLGYAGCHLELRQIARQKLRRQFDPNAVVNAILTTTEDEMFPETLQDRYPRARHAEEEPLYTLRDHMTTNDVEFNVTRMRKAGNALLKHADTLEAWNAARRGAA